jgi:hypothetical protein
MSNEIKPLAGVMLLTFGSGLLCGQPPRCTQDSVAGSYAIAAQGNMLITPAGAAQPISVPIANLALVSIDSQGTMAGQGFGSLGGTVSQTPGAGSIQVNPDCTAVVTTAAGTKSIDVVLDQGQEIRGLMIQAAGGKPVVQGAGRRICRFGRQPFFCNPRFQAIFRPAECSAADVRGVYAISYQGTYMVPQPGATQPVPVASLITALASIDYEGRLSGRGTATMAGDPQDYQILNGQIAVQPDCSATVQMSVGTGTLTDEGKSWLVVLDGGNELWAIQTESRAGKPVLAGVWKRLSTIP